MNHIVYIYIYIYILITIIVCTIYYNLYFLFNNRLYYIYEIIKL